MAVKKIENETTDGNAELAENGTPTNEVAASKADSKQQEYLNARRRTKTTIKVAVGIVVALVVVIIGGCAISSISSNTVAAGKAKISESSSSLKGKYFGDVQTLLEKDGFTNIELRPEGDLIAGVLHDDGEVETVSIDGKTSFSSGQQFDTDAKIVIAYHSYPAKSSNTTSNANANANANSGANTSNANADANANAGSNTNANTTAANTTNATANNASAATNSTTRS